LVEESFWKQSVRRQR